LVWQAAFALDHASPNSAYFCAMAKRFATDTCFNLVDQALQLLGGYGYLRDYPIERLLRDLRVHRILEGTNEIMRLVMARHIIQKENRICTH
jgi:alkylation response protein AidB-like acyl-CoA dehydrogenase